jgi:hypothetical protein
MIIAIRFGLLAVFAALAGTILSVGQSISDLPSLEGAVRSGQVREVTVLTGAPGDVFARQQVIWSTSWYDRITEVRPEQPGDLVESSNGAADIPSRDAGEYLTALAGDGRSELIVHRGSYRYTDTGVLNWRTPEWAGPSAVALWVAVLFVLVGGPHPWRATRWAWFWLLLGIPELAIPAFLLFSGPGLGLRPPRAGRRGFTGGWAFVLFLIFSGSN